MERLGLGADECLIRNSRLVYAHVTDWGQKGPWPNRVDHDINYLSVTGTLNAVGRASERPVPQPNLAADNGGGSILCMLGILAALIERSRSSLGQIVDTAMVDGASLLSMVVWAHRGQGV